MNWYIENPQRFRAERQELDNLVETADWLTPAGWTFDTSLRLSWIRVSHLFLSFGYPTTKTPKPKQPRRSRRPALQQV